MSNSFFPLLGSFMMLVLGCSTTQSDDAGKSGGGGAAGGASGTAGSGANAGSGGESGSAGAAGTGGSGATGGTSGGGGVAGSSGSSGSAGTAGAADPCAGGTADPSPAATYVSEHGFVELDTSIDNPIVAFSTSLVVPSQPPASGTLFLWPGLQPLPGGTNYQPIDNGVLQPVLTWGPTCAPNSPSSPYADWWVSAQYVNTVGQATGFTGCQGGEGMTVPVGDTLLMTFTLNGTVWNQTVTSQTTGASVSYDIDLQGQSQHRAEFLIEGYSSTPNGSVQFGPSVITFSNPSAPSCHVLSQGSGDVVAVPVSSPDGRSCCIASVTLNP